jgi:hypothetical protein
LLLATAAASLSTFAALRQRAAQNAEEIDEWSALAAKVVPAFPVASLGLLVSGAYMTESLGSWSRPWILASLAGLAMIIALGSGIEMGRARALKRELQRSGMSARARRLLRDPWAWSAKLMTLTLMGAIVFVMTMRPSASDAALSLVVAILVGLLAAVPLWRSPATPRGLAGKPRRELMRQ